MKSTDNKRSKSRSSSSSQRGSSTSSSCVSSAFSFDGISSGDLQLDSLGANQSELGNLLESLQGHDGAGFVSELTDNGCMALDTLDFGLSVGVTGLGRETLRQGTDADDVLGSQNNDALSELNGAGGQAGAFSGEHTFDQLSQNYAVPN